MTRRKEEFLKSDVFSVWSSSGRLCGVQRGDQAGPVSVGPGETVARQLLQVSDLRHCVDWGIHQQVGHRLPVTARHQHTLIGI